VTTVLPEYINEQQRICIEYFESWSESEQVHFVERLLRRMCHHQHGDVELFLRPMLQRDFISALPGLCCSVMFRDIDWNCNVCCSFLLNAKPLSCICDRFPVKSISEGAILNCVTLTTPYTPNALVLSYPTIQFGHLAILVAY